MRFLTQTDETGASARLRAYALLPYLVQEGFKVTIDPAPAAATTAGYVRLALSRLVEVPTTALANDVIVIQRDLVNHLAPWIEYLYSAAGTPLILDVDDAIDLRPPGKPPTWRSRLFGSGNKLEQLARLSFAVVAGNDLLAEKIRPWNPDVRVIPTCLDLSAFPRPAPRVLPMNRPTVIGWIGSPLTTPYLELVHGPLRELATRRKIVFRTVGAANLGWSDIPLDQHPWSRSTEAADVESFDIGIMPLTDDDWSRYKCGTKILQYFAAAVPVVASPVGMNIAALDSGRAGILAATERDWIEGIEKLLTDGALYSRLSAAGRDRAETRYDIRRHAPAWAALIREAARK